MFEPIKLDPLVNKRVIFKLRTQAEPMDAVVLGYDDAGYWIRSGTLAEYLKKADVSDLQNDVRYLEVRRIEWLQVAGQGHLSLRSIKTP